MAKSSLADKILAHDARVRGGLRCATCLLPPEILAEVHKAKAAGASSRSIVSVLADENVTVGESSVGGHFRKGHHVPRQ